MAKVTQQKDKDFDAIEPRISFQDMPEEKFTKIVQACRDAYSKFNNLVNQNYNILYKNRDAA